MTSKPNEHIDDDDLPRFLNDGGNAAAESSATTEAVAEATEALDAVTEADADTGPAPAPPPPDDAVAAGHFRGGPASAGSFGTVLGVALMCAALLVGVLHQKGLASPLLADYGLGPTTLLIAGLVVMGTSSLRRLFAHAIDRLDAGLAEHDDAGQQIRTSVNFLVEAQNAATQRPPAAGEELQRVMVSIQRQEEKLNNLAKAIKMYGKPLMEIANQGSDTADAVAQVRTHVDAIIEGCKQGFQRLEAASKGGGNKKELDDLRAQLAGLAELLPKALRELQDQLPDTGAMQQQLTRVEAVVQSLGQRLDDSEVRKSLLRLEDAGKHARETIEKLALGEHVQTGVHKLEQRIDAAMQKLGGGLEQLKTGNLGALETTIGEIRREVAGLATAVSQIQQAVKGGNLRAAAAVAAAAVPAPAMADARPAAHAAPAATPPPPNTEGLSDAKAGASQNQSGTRASSGKNVLGAIAKLKQMKS
ncbi:MAG TPA: hypothetical protein VK348_10695 [Planctomycetota bacterium]|nr:hypothetical protein [Planctomycetota bacterium]